jgi:NADH:ubiquinone reductase (H+-translocating)
MQRRVVIVGGGFGGLRVAQRLARNASTHRLDVTLIDQSAYHFLRPKLPQALGARIACAVHIPLAALLAKTPVRLLTKTVTSIDPAARRVAWDDGAIDADILVLALGGEPEVPSQLASDPGALLPVWGFDETCGIRRRVQFLSEAMRRGRPVNTDVIVVGGGFVGVEVAAELRARLTRIYGARTRATLTLVEAQNRLLPRLSAWAGQVAMRRLATLGVQVCTGTQVIQVTGGQLRFADGHSLRAGTIIWAGGHIRAPHLAVVSGLADDTGRIPVASTLETVQHPDVFALGDCAYEVARAVEACEPSAHRAEEEATTVVHNILARLEHRQAIAHRPGPSIYLLGLGPQYGLLERGTLRAAGVGLAWLKELVMLRHVMAVGGWGVLRGTAPRIVFDELRPDQWDKAPLPDGVADTLSASGRTPE